MQNAMLAEERALWAGEQSDYFFIVLLAVYIAKQLSLVKGQSRDIDYFSFSFCNQGMHRTVSVLQLCVNEEFLDKRQQILFVQTRKRLQKSCCAGNYHIFVRSILGYIFYHFPAHKRQIARNNKVFFCRRAQQGGMKAGQRATIAVNIPNHRDRQKGVGLPGAGADDILAKNRLQQRDSRFDGSLAAKSEQGLVNPHA
jgi:hypothetical protein